MHKIQKLFLSTILILAMMIGCFIPVCHVRAAVINVSENTVLNENNKLNLLYIESETLQTPNEQNIFASVGADDMEIVGGTIVIRNYRTGKEKTYSSSELFENSILFSVPYEAKDAGIYEVISLTVQTEEQEQTIILADTGIESSFYGVDEILTLNDGQQEDTVSTLEMENVNEADVDMQIISLNNDEDGVKEVKNALQIAENDTANTIGARTTVLKSESNVVVVLDPGHDATHGGSAAGGLNEATLNLKIAQYCKAELEQYQGVTVHMTRTTAACPFPGTNNGQDLESRVKYAASVGANYFISLHNNSSWVSSVNGATVYYPNANYNSSIGADGANLSTKILRQLTALGLKNNGIQIRNANDYKYPDGSSADFYAVIRHAKNAGIPGIIIEHAFQSNSSDAAFLKSESNLQKLGIADATGIAQHLGLNKVNREKVEAFVTRLYQKCLGRTPDGEGLNNWVNSICTGKTSGAAAAMGFFFSEEYLNKNVKSDKFIEDIYRVMMDRNSDPEGKADWLYRLDNGVERIGILNGFVGSEEFTKICDLYGITRGSLDVNGRNRSPGLTLFIVRLYTKTLGRDFEEDGLNNWCNIICDKKWTVDAVATTGFFNSDEFLNKNTTNGEYVEILYTTFLDRNSDPEGYANWIDKLEKGEKREKILEGFSQSTEFANLKANFGI